MTNIEALSAVVNYPVDEIKLNKILIDRGINEQDWYTGISRDFELATADVYLLLASSANISDSGYQVSMTDKSKMIDLATGIYLKYGLPDPMNPIPTVVKKPTIRNRSNYW